MPHFIYKMFVSWNLLFTFATVQIKKQEITNKRLEL